MVDFGRWIAMAKSMAAKQKSALRKRVGLWFGQLFCKRSIIIVSEHKTQHIPFAVGAQVVGICCALVVVGWASYSSGSYMAAKQVLEEKDKKIAITSEENERVAAEFSLLKRDLLTLAQDEKSGKSGKLGDYAQMVAETYTTPEDAAKHGTKPIKVLGKDDSIKTASAEESSNRYNAVFQRIDLLENKVRELQTTHQQMVNDIKDATGGKIAELERVIAATGVAQEPLVRQAELERMQDEQRREKYGRIERVTNNAGRGGPFEPIRNSMLKDKEPALYFDLKRMMVLNDVVSAMPLAFPLDTDDFRVSSGFGRRVDPFRGRLAFHAGVDLAGPDGVRVLAPSDGKVAYAETRGAYGNLIEIEHGYGFTTRYGHLKRILVREGQTVKKGQVVGVQGSTGRSTGHHLHYEVRYNDEPLNPSRFLKAGTDVRTVN